MSKHQQYLKFDVGHTYDVGCSLYHVQRCRSGNGVSLNNRYGVSSIPGGDIKIKIIFKHKYETGALGSNVVCTRCDLSVFYA